MRTRLHRETSRHRARALSAALCVAALSACSSGSEIGNPPGNGVGSGGQSAGSGGNSAGGNSAGGNNATGGSTGAGGAATGGSAGRSGNDAGTSTGGSSGGAGSGAAGSGGATGAGGGAGTGGSIGTGGASADGGGTSGCGLAPPMTGAFAGSVTVGAETRTYYMFVPAGYSSQLPQRLVLGFHGSNFTGRMMRTYLDLERAPLVDRTIFVYPDGANAATAWDLAENSRDMAFFDALVAQMEAQYCIDRDRIFATGQSFGALMTNAVGCFKGDVLRAIALAAGSGPRSTARCKDRVAAWLTHGMDDDSVPFTSGEASRDYWVTANGCTTTTVVGDPMQCLNYQGCLPGYPVIWCPHVNDAGHQIPSFGRDAMRKFLASF